MKALQQTTQRAVITIVTQDKDAGRESVALLPLWGWLVPLLLWLWQAGYKATRARYEVTAFWDDIKEATAFTGKVFTIGLNSFAFGIGVRI